MRVRILSNIYTSALRGHTFYAVPDPDAETYEGLKGSINISGHALHAVCPDSFEDDNFQYYFKQGSYELV